MELPNGTKRMTGFAILAITTIAPFFGYAPSDVAPIQMARFADELMIIVGLIVALYGEYKARAPLWFSKAAKETSK